MTNDWKKPTLCSCGMPQSYPMPHEHDLTEREKQIKKAAFEAGKKEASLELDNLREQISAIDKKLNDREVDLLNTKKEGYKMGVDDQNTLNKQAVKEAEEATRKRIGEWLGEECGKPREHDFVGLRINCAECMEQLNESLKQGKDE